MPKRILVVDDEAPVRTMLRQALEREGYEVREADDGDGGLRLLDKQPIDLVLLDIFMPNKEGIETLLEIRSLFPRLKFIVISGGGSRQNFSPLRAAKTLGAFGTLAKPFALHELLRMVSSALAEGGREAAAPVLPGRSINDA